MTKFREYYYKNLVNESPYKTGYYLPTDPDYHASNKAWAFDIVEKFKQVDTIEPYNDGNIYYVYQDKLDYYIIGPNKEDVVAEICFKVDKNGYNNIAMWRRKNSPLKMDWLILSYFLPKFKIILSDNALSTQGEAFWKKIIIDYTQNLNYNIGILKENKFITYTKPEEFTEDIWDDSNI